MRVDGRAADELRPITIERNYLQSPAGSALIKFGGTHVLCAATVEDRVPPFLRDTGSGWVTAEYAMLPASASGGRVSRDAIRKGRAMEISRLIGRSLRSVVNLNALGERQITIDCDVIQADGGTRTAAITGGFVALYDAMTSLMQAGQLSESPIISSCAAVSVGIVEGTPVLDLCYEEDSAASVDLNLVMKDDASIIEIQGTAEGETFPRAMLDRIIDLGEKGIHELIQKQRESLGIA